MQALRHGLLFLDFLLPNFSCHSIRLEIRLHVHNFTALLKFGAGQQFFHRRLCYSDSSAFTVCKMTCFSNDVNVCPFAMSHNTECIYRDEVKIGPASPIAHEQHTRVVTNESYRNLAKIDRMCTMTARWLRLVYAPAICV